MNTQDKKVADMEKTIHTLEKKIEVLFEQKDMLSKEKAILAEKARVACKSADDKAAALLLAEERVDRLLGVIELMAGGIHPLKD